MIDTEELMDIRYVVEGAEGDIYSALTAVEQEEGCEEIAAKLSSIHDKIIELLDKELKK